MQNQRKVKDSFGIFGMMKPNIISFEHPRRPSGVATEERVQRRHHPDRHVAAGIHAAPGRPGAPPALTSNPPRFHGVLAPNAKLRREIVPSPPEQATAPACDHAQGAPARLSWARLLKRVFDIDIEHCPNCASSSPGRSPAAG